MTERPNDAPDGDLEPSALEPAPDDGPEEAPDLTDAELRSATQDAEAEVDDGEDVALEGEADDDEVEQATEAAVPPPPARPGARARAEQARARATESHAVKAPRSTRTPFAIDPALRIKDPASAVFVAGTILVFVLVFLYAMAFGHGGAFQPT